MSSLDLWAGSLLSGLLLGAMLSLTALGLSITLGVMRLVNLAHGEMLIAGAYLSFYLLQYAGVAPLPGLPLVALVLALLAWPVYRWLVTPLQGKGPEASMMTMFGVSIILQSLFLLVFSADSRSVDSPLAVVPFSLGAISIPKIYLVGAAISVALVLAMHMLVAHTSFGRALRAASIDPVAAAVQGVDVRRVHALTFGLGAACAGVAGVLIGSAFSFTPSAGATYLLVSFAVVLLGGVGNIYGTLWAGLLIGVLQSVGGLLLGDGYRDLVGLLVFLIALSLKPASIVAEGASR